MRRSELSRSSSALTVSRQVLVRSPKVSSFKATKRTGRSDSRCCRARAERFLDCGGKEQDYNRIASVFLSRRHDSCLALQSSLGNFHIGARKTSNQLATAHRIVCVVPVTHQESLINIVALILCLLHKRRLDGVFIALQKFTKFSKAVLCLVIHLWKWLFWNTYLKAGQRALCCLVFYTWWYCTTSCMPFTCVSNQTY